mmetsp:Transcript_31587/g.72607  ORF Transcript_31587/g.72607 Transcript_31587/m.72607 type:complete len:250 (+) Transcript_31587:1324-2073(+)
MSSSVCARCGLSASSKWWRCSRTTDCSARLRRTRLLPRCSTPQRGWLASSPTRSRTRRGSSSRWPTPGCRPCPSTCRLCTCRVCSRCTCNSSASTARSLEVLASCPPGPGPPQSRARPSLMFRESPRWATCWVVATSQRNRPLPQQSTCSTWILSTSRRLESRTFSKRPQLRHPSSLLRQRSCLRQRSPSRRRRRMSSTRSSLRSTTKCLLPWTSSPRACTSRCRSAPAASGPSCACLVVWRRQKRGRC